MSFPEQLRERFEFVREIGEGGQGKTTLVRAKRDGQLFVLKELDLHGADPERAVRLFEREARTLESLRHPAIPRYVDELQLPGDEALRYFIVQEFVEGQTLQEIIDSGKPFPTSEVYRLLRELAETLEYLHGQEPPVLHRDIKPANIIVRPDGGVALVDFGAAQHVRRSANSNTTVLGTTGYMAPEQFTGRAVEASDIYGLGATMVHLVTRTHPIDLLDSSLRLEFEDRVTNDDVLREILARMTQSDVEERFPNASEVLAILDEPQGVMAYKPPPTATMLTRVAPRGSKVEVHRTPNGLRVVLPASGRRTLLIEVAVGLFCLGLLGSVFFLPSGMDAFNVAASIFGVVFAAVAVRVTNELRRLTRATIEVEGRHVKIVVSRFGTREYLLRRPKVTVEATGSVVGGSSDRPTAIRFETHNEEVDVGHLLSSRERDWVVEELRSVLSEPPV